MKICKKCGVEKPLTAFCHHARCADGRVGTCKQCKLQAVPKPRRGSEIEVRTCPACGIRFSVRKSIKKTCCGKECSLTMRRSAKNLGSGEWKMLGKKRVSFYKLDCMPDDKWPCDKYQECLGIGRKKRGCRVEPRQEWCGTGILTAINIGG